MENSKIERKLGMNKTKDNFIKSWNGFCKLRESTKTYLASIGQKGGKSGIGKAKKRGDASYYKRIAKLKRKAKK